MCAVCLLCVCAVCRLCVLYVCCVCAVSKLSVCCMQAVCALYAGYCKSPRQNVPHSNLSEIPPTLGPANQQLGRLVPLCCSRLFHEKASPVSHGKSPRGRQAKPTEYKLCISTGFRNSVVCSKTNTNCRWTDKRQDLTVCSVRQVPC